ncbi:hypothetical protein QJS10_CPB12g00974 [Acorus calamus]|uniref:Uncharacterized protein n=1 Tax=Acorus calamus TaxID=4465 RepID=A0AAV9DK16_ACOCL|nr:hypothetical protein QJS10_CPB12g00974 [Acorus calamus]
MTSTKKTRNKRLSKLIEESPDKDGNNGKKNKPRIQELVIMEVVHMCKVQINVELLVIYG